MKSLVLSFLFSLLLFSCGSDRTSVPIEKALPVQELVQAPTVISVTPANTGWTQIPLIEGSKKIYVSNSVGNDNNDGLSVVTPVKTIAKGKSLVRHGFSDQLLLLRGDIWEENIGHWKYSGSGKNSPILISTYGTSLDRPILKTGQADGIFTSPGGGSPDTINNLAIIGIHFWANGYTGLGECVGARILQPGSNFLIEDCKFEGYSTNLVFQGFNGTHTNFKLRRSVIVDAYSVINAGQPHSQGLYAYAVNGLLIEENLFDHNGWSEVVPGAGADIYSHNIYIDNGNFNVIVRANIISNAGSHGMQLRCGGRAVNNLFYRNSISLQLGGGNAPEPEGVTAHVVGNVILNGKNIDEEQPRGWGLLMANISYGIVDNNIIANNTLGTQPAALILDGMYRGESGNSIGIHNLTLRNNIIFNWGNGLLISGDAQQITNLILSKNKIQSGWTLEPIITHDNESNVESLSSSQNIFYNTLLPPNMAVHIGESTHSLEDWLALIKDTTSEIEAINYPILTPKVDNELLLRARQQSRQNWKPALMAVNINNVVRRSFTAEQ